MEIYGHIRRSPTYPQRLRTFGHSLSRKLAADLLVETQGGFERVEEADSLAFFIWRLFTPVLNCMSGENWFSRSSNRRRLVSASLTNTLQIVVSV